MQGPHNPPAKKSGIPTFVIVLIVIAALAVPALGIMSALAIYGVSRYLRNAKRSEGSHGVVMLANGIARCAESEGASGRRGLPPTSAKVPAAFSSVSRFMKYQSAPAEWSGDAAFACASFSMSHPQYFQYQWEKRSESSGVAHAIADLDGDGAPDPIFEVLVTCAGGACNVGPVIER